MRVRFNVVLPDDLKRAVNRVAEEAETSKSEILRKSMQLFLAALEGKPQFLALHTLRVIVPGRARR